MPPWPWLPPIGPCGMNGRECLKRLEAEPSLPAPQSLRNHGDTTRKSRNDLKGRDMREVHRCEWLKRPHVASNRRVYLAFGSVGTRIRLAVVSNLGTSQRNNSVAAIAPASCAATNKGTSTGRIPANVSDNERAIVTAGFANDVEEVNQYAAVMYAATANGTTLDRWREQPQITQIKPNVATNSLKV
jgi:hypothetical protein